MYVKDKLNREAMVVNWASYPFSADPRVTRGTHPPTLAGYRL